MCSQGVQPFSIQLSVHGTEHLRRAYKKCTLCRCRYYGTRAVVTLLPCSHVVLSWRLNAPLHMQLSTAALICALTAGYAFMIRFRRPALIHRTAFSTPKWRLALARHYVSCCRRETVMLLGMHGSVPHSSFCTTSSSQCTHSVLLELRRLANTMRLLRECTCLLIKSLHTHTNTTSVVPQQAILALRHCKLRVGVLICSLAHVWHA